MSEENNAVNLDELGLSLEEVQGVAAKKRHNDILNNMFKDEKNGEALNTIYNDYGLKDMIDADSSIVENKTALSLAIKTAKANFTRKQEEAKAAPEQEQQDNQEQKGEDKAPLKQVGNPAEHLEDRNGKVLISSLTAEELLEKSKGLTFGDALIAKTFLG